MKEDPLAYSSFLFNSDRIKVGFYTFDEKLIYSNNYKIYQVIKDIKDDFFNQNTEDYLIKFLGIGIEFNKNNLDFYYKNDEEQIQKLNDEKSLSLCCVPPKGKILDSNQSTSEQQQNILKIYVRNDIKYVNKYDRISSDFEEYIIKNTYLIGRPIINHHKYYLYNKKNEKLKIITYKVHQTKELQLQIYLGINSYCNANNNLYIYEGNSSNFMSNNSKFIKINLITNDINIISTNFPSRILHSMIFIPECYIFIIGGKNTRKVIIYTIEENNENYEYYPYNLPEELIEPSLIYINNRYLYIFENSTLYFQIIKTDIINVERWEEIKIKNFKYNINQKFFGVVKKGNCILLLGGQMLNLFHDSSNTCFSYNYEFNIIDRCQTVFKAFEFMEKTFIPIEKKKYFQLAEIKKGNEYIPKRLIIEDV